MDHSLDEYYAACHLDSDSDASSTSSRDGAGISPWRAASGVSPLRGRARVSSAQCRTSCANLRDQQLCFQKKEANLEPCWTVCSQGAPQRARSQTVNQIIQALNQPLSAHLRCATVMGKENDIARHGIATSSQQGGLHPDPGKGLLKSFDDKDLQVLLLFDVLCALRLSACKFCVKETSFGPCGTSNSKTKFPAVWRLKPEVRDQLLCGKGWVTYLSALQKLLSIADEIHVLQSQLDTFYEQHHKMNAEADSTYAEEVAVFFGRASIGDRTVHADRALGCTSLSTLFRFAELVSAWVGEFKHWVFQVQEDLVRRSGSCAPLDRPDDSLGCGLCANSCNTACKGSFDLSCQSAQYDSAEGVRKMRRAEGLTTSSVVCAGSILLDALYLPQIVAAVERNATLLQRCQIIIVESGCFSAFQTKSDALGGAVSCDEKAGQNNEVSTAGQPSLGTSSIAVVSFLNQCTELGAALLDHLIIQLSALQHPGTIDLYRLYMSLLIHCAWPYIILSTATIFGFVHGIDSQKWRHQLPRLFRSSFSHICVSGAHRRFPTDVLSLILSCADYQKSAVSLEPFKTLSALSSARRFILRSLQTFAKQRRKSQAAKEVSERQTAWAGLNAAAPSAQSMGASSSLATAEPSGAGLPPAHPFSAASKVSLGKATPPAVETQRGPLHCQAATFFTSDNERKGQREKNVLQSWGLPQQQGHSSSHLPNHGNDGPTSVGLPLCFLTIEQDAVEGRCSLGVAEVAKGGGGRSNGAVLHHRWGSLWSLQVWDCKTTPELLLSNRCPHGEGGNIATREGGPRGGRKGLDEHILWLDTTMPAARWIAAALLIPIGVVVQRLQQRRVAGLFQGSGSAGSTGLPKAYQRAPEAILGGSGKADQMFADEVTFEDYLELEKAQLVNSEPITRHKKGGTMMSSLSCSVASFGLTHALDLLIDIALCRDKTCILESFLERLYVEPRWWQRASTSGRNAHGGGGPVEGTASTLISSLFTEALRGKRYGNLVQLRVLPKQAKTIAQKKGNTGGASRDADTRAKAGVGVGSEKRFLEENLLAYEMLDVFESFQLIFHFPEAVELILLPKRFSVRLRSETDIVEGTYFTLFWGKRRERLANSRLESNQVHYDPTTKGSLNASEGAGDQDALSVDVWSCAFGYMCALHFAQITLREHRKSLHIRDTQDNQLLSVLGRPLPSTSVVTATTATTTTHKGSSYSSANSLKMVARSLGSSYYLLSFAVDTFLTFTQREVAIAIYKLQHLMGKAETLSSAMQLCQELDAALVGIQYICFLAGKSTAPFHGHPERDDCRDNTMAAEADARQALRAHICTILSFALDPTRMPPKYIGTRSRNTIEALVALVSALQDFSLLKKRLQPLLVLLTFNNFFGSDKSISFQFR